MLQGFGVAVADRWLGVHVSGDGLVIVDAEVPEDGPIVIIADESWKLENGARPKAFQTIYKRLSDYVRDKGIAKAVIKESAANARGMGLAHLQAAELRGVAICALACGCPVEQVSKSKISKGFGKRKADEYLKDNDFWKENLGGVAMRAGSREAALLILATR